MNIIKKIYSKKNHRDKKVTFSKDKENDNNVNNLNNVNNNIISESHKILKNKNNQQNIISMIPALKIPNSNEKKNINYEAKNDKNKILKKKKNKKRNHHNLSKFVIILYLIFKLFIFKNNI